ncbi:2-succinyl-6-hydroxy-2,4-cyclohexadiene-1-carboxylate synthase [Thalassobacillus cyri]|uniref:Putative 2-succinyl-6-hydroxy-2,4-cyclohexadiene-1-carboxylate synthase n=1 Tax=Thalassobacillus cyri TaxID=571932 RepID=A0A1H4G7V7_9BACI|nr:2-succinyl-6-hydroxy-2,4-cyclohexadiene-1-carboxylate synthase [Thalassobacillus cyri]SEB04978.1 2-succinyl-6-hydroxy-2,4-cyclohexadiene-1-carboxylate synthase [Thalassobacillus cyri]
MFYQINGSDYWVEVNGEGVPLVMLHGFTGSTRTWAKVIGALSELPIQLITIDLPGHGRTEYNNQRTLSMENVCKDLKILFEENLKFSSIHLLGYSMGGRTALSFASFYPEFVDKLLLESASPGLRSLEERQERAQKDKSLATKLEAQGIEAFIDFWETIPLFDSQRLLPVEIQAAIREERLSQTVDGLSLSLRGMGTGTQPSFWEELYTLTIPVQLIVGAWDEKFSAINQAMKKMLPEAKLHVVKEAGHAVHVEQPKFFAEIVRQFMLE